MISLSEHRTSLLNLPVTLKALADIETLIENYRDQPDGVAYVAFDFGGRPVQVQLRAEIAISALNGQRAVLVEYLATLGITA
jgi:hypothetical protein